MILVIDKEVEDELGALHHLSAGGAY